MIMNMKCRVGFDRHEEWKQSDWLSSTAFDRIWNLKRGVCPTQWLAPVSGSPPRTLKNRELNSNHRSVSTEIKTTKQTTKTTPFIIIIIIIIIMIIIRYRFYVILFYIFLSGSFITGIPERSRANHGHWICPSDGRSP